jgi:hypothetical protein
MNDDARGSALLVAVVAIVAALMVVVLGLGYLLVKGRLHPLAVASAAVSSASAAPVVTAAAAPSVLPSAPPPIATVAPTASATAPPVVAPPQPSPTTPQPESASASDATAAVARLRPGFRSCYTHGLVTDPSMSGNIVIAIRIGPRGDVTRVDKVRGSGLSPAVEKCILDEARTATFAPPGGSGSTIQFPVTFVSQQ